MLKILHQGITSKLDVDLSLVPVGTLFYANMAYRKRSLYLRIYDGIIDLENPHSTWTQRKTDFPIITDYVEVDGVLTITNKE